MFRVISNIIIAEFKTRKANAALIFIEPLPLSSSSSVSPPENNIFIYWDKSENYNVNLYQNNMCLSKKIIIPRMQRILDPCIFFWLHLFFRMKQLRSFLKSGLESLNSSFWLNGISSIQHASWQLFFFLTSSYPLGQRLVALSAASAYSLLSKYYWKLHLCFYYSKDIITPYNTKI